MQLPIHNKGTMISFLWTRRVDIIHVGRGNKKLSLCTARGDELEEIPPPPLSTLRVCLYIITGLCARFVSILFLIHKKGLKELSIGRRYSNNNNKTTKTA